MKTQTDMTKELSRYRLSWSEQREAIADQWEQGQHFTILAPTGGGKSVVAVKGLLPMWQYSITLDAKGEDWILSHSGRKVRNYPNGLDRYRFDRFWLALPPDEAASARISHDALSRVFAKKGWTVYIDELRLFTDRHYLAKYEPRLLADVERLWLYGRSRGITLVTGTQAPRWIPAAAYEQSRFFLIGTMRDERAVKRLGEISGNVDKDLVAALVPRLERFEFLYVGANGFISVATYPLKGSKK